MSRYFMNGTRLEGYERMMMDSSRRPEPEHREQRSRSFERRKEDDDGLYSDTERT